MVVLLLGLAAAVVLSSDRGLDTAACYPRRLKTAHGGRRALWSLRLRAPEPSY